MRDTNAENLTWAQAAVGSFAPCKEFVESLPRREKTPDRHAGYARLVRQEGGDVVVTDKQPPGVRFRNDAAKPHRPTRPHRPVRERGVETKPDKSEPAKSFVAVNIEDHDV